MNEEIKIGETYNVKMEVTDMTPDYIYASIHSSNYDYIIDRNHTDAFSPITPEKGSKNTEESPKYDPCRLLKKGDRVQVKRRNGRCNGKDGEYLREAFCKVAENEVPNELVRVYHNSSEYKLDPAYLELVTPVEELEPYKIAFDDVTQNWNVIKDDVVLCSYKGTKHPHAEKSAEAECKRLNEEYRKEQA